MLKLTAILSLMLIATWSQADTRRYKKDASNSGSTLWAASLSCDSCGSECTSACGTRHFRSCCFNYLRRKRGPDAVNFWSPNSNDVKVDQKYKHPMFLVENVPEWMTNFVSSDYKPYSFEDAVENRLLTNDI